MCIIPFRIGFSAIVDRYLWPPLGFLASLGSSRDKWTSGGNKTDPRYLSTDSRRKRRFSAEHNLIKTSICEESASINTGNSIR